MESPTQTDTTFEDRVLARRILAGDEEAFEEFFDGHFPALYRFVLARLKEPEVSRDIVQSALCKAVARLETYRAEASLAAWVYGICRHEISNHRRRTGRAPAMVELVEEEMGPRSAGSPASQMTGPAESLERKEVAELVHSTLDELPPRYGLALEWKYIDGLPVREIAQRLKVSPKAAESILTRARQAFRDRYQASGPELLVWGPV